MTTVSKIRLESSVVPNLTIALSGDTQTDNEVQIVTSDEKMTEELVYEEDDIKSPKSKIHLEIELESETLNMCDLKPVYDDKTVGGLNTDFYKSTIEAKTQKILAGIIDLPLKQPIDPILNNAMSGPKIIRPSLKFTRKANNKSFQKQMAQMSQADAIMTQRIIQSDFSELEDPSLLEIEKIVRSVIKHNQTAFDKRKIKSNCCFVVGVNELSTEDIMGYFRPLGPQKLEWIDDNSCLILWENQDDCIRSFLKISKEQEVTIIRDNNEVIDVDMEDINNNSPKQNVIKLPNRAPGSFDNVLRDTIIPLIRHTKQHDIQMRLAVKGDTKLKRPNRKFPPRFNNYESNLPHPMAGMGGFISSSMRSKIENSSKRTGLFSKNTDTESTLLNAKASQLTDAERIPYTPSQLPSELSYQQDIEQDLADMEEEAGFGTMVADKVEKTDKLAIKLARKYSTSTTMSNASLTKYFANKTKNLSNIKSRLGTKTEPTGLTISVPNVGEQKYTIRKRKNPHKPFVAGASDSETEELSEVELESSSDSSSSDSDSSSDSSDSTDLESDEDGDSNYKSITMNMELDSKVSTDLASIIPPRKSWINPKYLEKLKRGADTSDFDTSDFNTSDLDGIKKYSELSSSYSDFRSRSPHRSKYDMEYDQLDRDLRELESMKKDGKYLSRSDKERQARKEEELLDRIKKANRRRSERDVSGDNGRSKRLNYYKDIDKYSSNYNDKYDRQKKYDDRYKSDRYAKSYRSEKYSKIEATSKKPEFKIPSNPIFTKPLKDNILKDETKTETKTEISDSSSDSSSSSSSSDSDDSMTVTMDDSMTK